MAERAKITLRPIHSPTAWSSPATPNAVTVMLLDGINTRLEDQVYAKERLIRFIQRMQPEDSVALYVLGHNVQILHDFTSDTESLIRAATSTRAASTQRLPIPGCPPTRTRATMRMSTISWAWPFRSLPTSR